MLYLCKMILGNIISDKIIKVGPNIKSVTNEADLISGLPTLYVGYELAMKSFYNLDTTQSKIDELNFWTEKITERRDDYNRDLSHFINFIYQKHIESVNYVYIDLLATPNKTLIKIYRKIRLNKSLCYSNDKMIYFLCENNLLFGLDIRVVKFCELNLPKLKKLIKEVSYKIITRKNLTKEHKVILNSFGDNEKVIPIIYSLLS